MSGTVLIAALFAAELVLIALFFKLSGEEGNKHFLLKVLFLGFIVGILILIGKVGVDYNDNCAWLVQNSTVSGSTTSYGYDYTCSVNTNNTAQIFYQVLLWFARFIGIYLFFYIVIAAYKAISGVLGKGR